MIKAELLQFFVEIAKTNSIHLASERLYITQPAVSRGIRALENELGLILFERKYDGTYLTEDGAELLNYAQNVLKSQAEFTAKAQELKNRRIPELRRHTTVKLFVSTPILDRFIPYLTYHLNNHLPEMHLNVIEYSSKSRYNSESVFEELNSTGSIGIFLIPNIADEIFAPNGLTSDILAISKITVMSSPKSKFIPIDSAKLTAKDLAQMPFILYTDPFLAASLYEQVLADFPHKPPIIEESNLNLLLQYIRNDLGVTFACNIFDYISPDAETEEVLTRNQGLRYTPLVTPFYYKLILVYQKNNLTPPLENLLTVIRSMWQ